MLRVSQIWIGIIVIVCGALEASASNRHEHPYAWLTASSLFSAYQSELGRKLKDEQLSTLYKYSSYKDVHRPIIDLFPHNVSEMLIKKYGVQLGQQTIRQIAQQVAELLNAPEQEIVESFFKLGDHTQISGESYRANEQARKGVIKLFKYDYPTLYEDFLLNAYGTSLEQIPSSQRKYMDFSVPGSLVDSSLVVLKELFIEHGSKVEFLYSYPRSKLAGDSDKQFGNKMTAIERALSLGWIRGVDISGSLDEGGTKVESFDRQRLFDQRIRRIETLLAKYLPAIYRFHVFELHNEGNFYKAMWSTLREIVQRSEARNDGLRVRIGHIAKLRAKDIKRFVALKKSYHGDNFPIEFEFNLTSNTNLSGSSRNKLRNTARQLIRKGFRVYMSADGQGIWGPSSHLTEQTLSLSNHFALNNYDWVGTLLDMSRQGPGLCEFSLGKSAKPAPQH